MILFLSDWAKYPGAIVDTKCPNESFINLAHVLKKMGVKNYYFFLALHNPLLSGVDPYDDDLTDQQKIWISEEIAINPWYWFRYAPVPEGSKKNRFRANRANISLFWSFFNNCQYLLIQPRQTGKSYSTDTLMVYLLSFSTGLRSLLYTKDRPLAIKNIIRLRKLMERMPEFLNPLTKKDSMNQETITVLSRSNYYNTIVAQESEEDADKKGRGDTVEVRHCDEIAYCKNNHITIPTMASAMNAARDDALKEGKFTGSIFTTTAGKKDSPHGAWAYELFEESAEWNDLLFYDSKDKEEFEKRVREKSNPKSDIAKITGLFSIQGTFSHRQLGYTDEWLIGKIVENRVSPEAALRDYYNVWTSGNEISPFTTKQLQMISNSKQEPVYRDIGLGGLTVKWYYNKNRIEEIMNTRPIIVGMDSSSNVGRDSTTLTFTDATSLDLIGAADCNNINLYNYAQWLADLMVRYPKILIVPENRSSAQGIIDYLIEVLPGHNIDPFKRVFNIVVNEREFNPRRFDSMDAHPSRMTIANQYRPLFGYPTSGTGKYSRNNLYNETLYRAIDIVADKIKDDRLIKELLDLVVIDGRIDHVKGKHDDQVISWLLSCWFVFNAREVFYYDIIKQRFLSNVVEAGEKIDYDKIAYNRNQELIRNKIESIYNEMTTTEDYFEFSKLEKAVKLLETKLDYENKSKLVGMSDMISDLKENRKMRLMKQSPDAINNILEGLNNIHEENNHFGRNYFTNTYPIIDSRDNFNYNPNEVDTIDSLEYWLN